MDDDFERRRELRRQKREEMRLEAERMCFQRMDDDEEEAARERRRRARQERLRNKDFEEPVAVEMESVAFHGNSVTEREAPPTSQGEDEQALLERLAKREERRQRRLKDALERQQEDGVETTPADTATRGHRSWHRDVEEEQGRELCYLRAAVKEEEEHVASKEEYAVPEDPAVEVEKPEEAEVEDEQEEKVLEEKPRRSYLREQAAEEKPRSSLFAELTGERGTEPVLRQKENVPPTMHENGGLHDDSMAKHQKPERTLSRGSMRAAEAEEQDDAARLEAERKLEELKRRRDETESEEFQKMRQKQQEAEAELEELKRKREERRKVLEEEERLRKQELAEKKAKEEEEKRRMKEEIERRRAEAAEKRQKVEESPDGETRKPFQCVGPRGASLKIGERAEFLNKSAQKSSVKTSHTPVVSKIDNRLEQYTSAVQTNKELKSSKAAAIDLPVLTDGIRSIKSMWEKGNVSSSSGAPVATNKDAAGMKIGVAGRINDWLTKAPESSRTAGGKPADLRPGDVTNKRNLWENKSSAPSKVNVGEKSKCATNGK